MCHRAAAGTRARTQEKEQHGAKHEGQSNEHKAAQAEQRGIWRSREDADAEGVAVDVDNGQSGSGGAHVRHDGRRPHNLIH